MKTLPTTTLIAQIVRDASELCRSLDRTKLSTEQLTQVIAIESRIAEI